MRRIVILGITGSGKTTFGHKLGAALGLRVTDLDDLYWLPNWVERDTPAFYDLAEKTAAEDAWVIVGNYSKVRQAVWPLADTFIWLDYSFSHVFMQLVRRSIRRASDKTPICNGNIETWGKLFSKDSIMIWLFKSYARTRRNYGEIFAGTGFAPKVTYIRLRCRRDADRFLAGISPANKIITEERQTS
ncbi:MAG: hypothetical protein PW788_10870 [Micavibrio sp.]|nr:hypothetical protein [Micavibrio sp.]